MFWNKPKSVLGIDIGAGGVKVVELRPEKGRPVLFTYGYTSQKQNVHRLSQMLREGNKFGASFAGKVDNKMDAGNIKTPVLEVSDEEVGKYADMIKAVCQKAKTVSKMATVSLPVSAVFHAVVNLPPVKKEDLPGILKAEVKKLIPVPIEDMVLDYQMLPAVAESKARTYIVNAVPKTLMAFYTKIFSRAGLTLTALEPESSALARSLVGRDTGVVMVLDIGAEQTNFFIIEQGLPMTHKTIEMGGDKINKILKEAWQVTDSDVEKMKMDLFSHLLSSAGKGAMEKQRFLDLFSTVFDPIVKEIEYGLEVYLRQSNNVGKMPEKVILSGGGSFLPYLPEVIADKFKLKCYVGDPWGRVVYQDGLRPVLNAVGPRLSVAIGLALRNMVK